MVEIPPASVQARRVHRRDAILVAIVAVATWALCARFNVTELLRRLTAPYERYQLDELPTVLLTRFPEASNCSVFSAAT